MLANPMESKPKNIKIVNVFIYVVFTYLMILAVANKVNLNVDEVYSYGLSNSTQGMNIIVEDGVTYYPSNTPWLNYMAVDPDARFRYDLVWRNQSDDVHPPLYYALLHTICSSFPNIVTIWFAALINIVFALGVLFFVRKLVFLLTQDEWITKFTSLAFICSAGILSSVTFMRMYIMAMFWITALTYVIVKQIGAKTNLKYCLLIFLCTTCGALTHYYCIVYAVFLSIAYGCYLIYNKQWKEISFICLTQGLSAIVSIGVFPSMLAHIFSGYRGTQSFDNMLQKSFLDSLSRINQFWRMFDKALFGDLLIYFICILVIFVVMNGWRSLYRTLSFEDSITNIRYWCMICPIIVYFLLVSRIAIIITDRYVTPVYGVAFAAVFSAAGGWCRKFIKTQYRNVLALVLVIVTVSGWKGETWPYLCQGSKPLLNKAAGYSETDCVYVYDLAWKINSSYKEIANYHSVTFYHPSNLQQLGSSDLSTRYELIVVSIEGLEGVVDEVLTMCPYLDAYEYLGSYGSADSYHLYAQRDGQ